MATKESPQHDRNNNIQCIAVNSDETCMYVLTQQGQLIFCNIDIKAFEDTLVDNLIFNYVIS